MSYDLTSLNTTTTNWLQLTQYVNVKAEYWIGSLFLLGVFIFCMVAFRREESMQELTLSTFITSIVSLLMLFAGLVTWQVTLFPIFGFIISFLLMFFL